MINHNQEIAVLAFCLLAGCRPIFKAKNTIEVVSNLLGPCVPRAVWPVLSQSMCSSEVRAHLYTSLIYSHPFSLITLRAFTGKPC